MNKQRVAFIVACLLGLIALAPPQVALAASASSTSDTYSDDEVARAASQFFATGAKDLSDVLAKVLKEKGHPVGFIRGEEAGGAVGVGLRYGHGQLVLKSGGGRKVYWQGPSIGFDVGGNASKVFVLVYGLKDTRIALSAVSRVEGSLYFVAGSAPLTFRAVPSRWRRCASVPAGGKACRLAI